MQSKWHSFLQAAATMGCLALLAMIPVIIVACPHERPIRYDCSEIDHEMWLKVYESCRENGTHDEWCRTTANEALCKPLSPPAKP